MYKFLAILILIVLMSGCTSITEVRYEPNTEESSAVIIEETYTPEVVLDSLYTTTAHVDIVNPYIYFTMNDGNIFVWEIDSADTPIPTTSEVLLVLDSLHTNSTSDDIIIAWEEVI